jgi:hypothetical protein
MKEDEEGKKECPVCGKEVFGIEAHVEKCLFLNSSSEPPQPKRGLEQPSSDPQPSKKHKPSSPTPHVRYYSTYITLNVITNFQFPIVNMPT